MAMTLIFVCPAARAAEGKEYTFGFRMDSSAHAGQVKELMTRGASVLKRKYDLSMKLAVYNDDKTFLEMLKKRQLDFIYAWNVDLNIFAVRKAGYTPIVGLSVFDNGGNDELCLYSRNESKIDRIEDLKDKKALICGVTIDYYSLRKLLGVNPADYFINLKTRKDMSSCLSMFYPLSLGEADTAFVSSTTYKMYKINNPGAIKDIKATACAKPKMGFFILASKNVPPEVISKFKSIMESYHKEKEIKDVAPLIKMTKARMFPVTIEDYRGLFDLYAEAEKKGWDKEFERLLKAQGTE